MEAVALEQAVHDQLAHSAGEGIAGEEIVGVGEKLAGELAEGERFQMGTEHRDENRAPKLAVRRDAERVDRPGAILCIAAVAPAADLTVPHQPPSLRAGRAGP